MLSVQFLVVDLACSASCSNFLEVAETKLPLFVPRIALSRKMAARVMARPSLLRHLQLSFTIRAFVPSSLVAVASWSRLFPKLESLLELFPPWLLAAPKKKTSHSRKRMRSANKGLQDKESEFRTCESLVYEGVNAPCICRYYGVPSMWTTAAHA